MFQNRKDGRTRDTCPRESHISRSIFILFLARKSFLWSDILCALTYCRFISIVIQERRAGDTGGKNKVTGLRFTLIHWVQYVFVKVCVAHLIWNMHFFIGYTFPKGVSFNNAKKRIQNMLGLNVCKNAWIVFGQIWSTFELDLKHLCATTHA